MYPNRKDNIKSIEMENLRKAFKISHRDGHKGHEKMPDRKKEERDAIRQGVKFYVDYLGSTLVEELDEGQSYGDKISAKSVKTIHDMAKAGHRKCHKVEISISVKGIKVTDTEENILLTSLSIYRIHFCTADKHHDHIFAYIARSTENEIMECHAFLCQKKKIAHTIALTVAQSFQLAKEDFEAKEKEKERKKLNADFPQEDEKEQKPQTHHSTTNGENQSHILGFEDNFVPDIQYRNQSPQVEENRKVNPFRHSTFNIGVEVEDLNNSLLQWLETQEAQKRIATNNNNEDLIKF